MARAKRDLVREELFGKIIHDPYRWLEDPDSGETAQFVREQNEAFQSFIKQSPIRPKLSQALTKLMDYPRYGCPMKRGSYFYYWHNSGLQAQSVLYQQEDLKTLGKVFLDPNSLSSDGTTSVKTYSFSKSGKYFAYGLSVAGSDWTQIYVKTTELGAENLEPSPIEWAKFTSIEWTHDDKGFFYNRYKKPETLSSDKAGTETDSNKNATIFYHSIGTSQDDDLKIFSIPENPDHMPSVVVSDDGKFLVLSVMESCDPKNKLYVADISNWDRKTAPKIVPIVEEFKANFNYLTNDGSLFWFETTLDAPKKKVVKFDLNNPEKGFVTLLPESADVIDFSHVVANDKLVIVTLKDVKHVATVYSLYDGTCLSTLPLPVGSMISSIQGRREDTSLFYSFTSFITPGKIHQYDFSTKQALLYRENIVSGLRSDDLVVDQVFYHSKDGTKIPMFIIHKKNIKLDGNNACLLYGYGGFNISITPYFSSRWVTFIQHMNGIVCVANLRGGGEYGQTWYDGGKLKNKQNVFDDFQWAAKWLIENKYTNNQRLAINGGSNGGLLVGACINQAPELFACAIADVGVMDMLRFHKFTIGHAWISDYGSFNLTVGNPDVKEDFEVLIKYSPLHTVKKQKYPAVLICTGDHDDRVVPLHSLKYLATLQHEVPDNERPILGRIETKAGHGAGKSTQQIIEENADKFAFIGLVLGAEWNE